jgi:hypothetical protein
VWDTGYSDRDGGTAIPAGNGSSRANSVLTRSSGEQLLLEVDRRAPNHERNRRGQLTALSPPRDDDGLTLERRETAKHPAADSSVFPNW